MKPFRRSNKNKTHISNRSLLFFLTLACCGAIFVSLSLNITGGPLHTLAGLVFSPMQKGITQIGSGLSSATTDYQNLQELKTENEALSSEIAELREEINTMKLDQYELDNYKELLDLNDKYDSFETLAATVISREADNWFSSFTIDKGSLDGVEVNMNVMAGTGLVGIVTSTGPNYSLVRSIIDDSSNVSALVTTTRDNCNVTGSLESMGTSNTILFDQLQDDENLVNEGDPVVTSYISDLYQPGILIGYIVSIENDSNGLTKTGTIAPVVDFEHLEHVLIVTNQKKDGTVDASTLEDEGETEGTEAADTDTEEADAASSNVFDDTQNTAPRDAQE